MERRRDQIERKLLPFTAKAASVAENGAGEFEGYAAGILNIDSVGDMILPGAFKEDLPRFLSEGVVCWQHDWTNPIGVPLEAREDGYGLFTKCRISKTTQGQDAMTLIKDGVVKKLSIGYRVEDYTYVDRSGLTAFLAGMAIEGERQASIIRSYDEQELEGVYLLKKLKLYEYSPVTIPANDNAIITDAKSLTGLTFQAHSRAVLTAVEGLKTRIADIAALRNDQGRKANPMHCEMCRSMADDLETMCRDLRQIAVEMEPEPEPLDTAKAATLYAEFLRLEALRVGAA
jgi:HK97 family phage prohead protease